MFEKILVPVDFGDIVQRPVALALELARVHGAKVTLLVVVDDSFPNPDIMSFQMPWADYHRHLRDEAKARLGALSRELGAEGDVEQVILRGQPARTIVKFAAEEGHDLVVMATRGASGLQHALLGSVTRKVLHDAGCPVLVVRVQEEGGQAGA